MSEATAPLTIRPQAGPQERFMASPADIALYGGAAGGGKTFALLLEPLRHSGNPAFGCVLFRRTYPQVTNEGAMWDQSRRLYPLLAARPKYGELSWQFPSGATVSFGHLQHESSVDNYQGAQVALIGFDQLEQFTEYQFWYLTARNRSTSGVRPYIRCTANPDADSWVARFWAWWIDQETGLPIPERAGVLRWFVRVGEHIIWADTRWELEAEYPAIPPKSVTFVPARLTDNAILMAADPSYLGTLLALPLLERERLLEGNWKVRAAAGKVFNRAWFTIVEAAPAGGGDCLYWDFAATEKKPRGADPDATAGVHLRSVGGAFYVLDVTCEQVGPAASERLYENVSRQRAAVAAQQGARFRVRFEIEPGSAAQRDALRLVQLLAGLDVAGVASRVEKITRARGYSAQAGAGNVFLIRAPWNEAYLTQLHHQPDWPHDDMLDASSGAFNDLTGGQVGGSFGDRPMAQRPGVFSLGRG